MTTHPPLRIDSDLTFTSTAPTGPVTGQIQAAGSHITITTTDPAATLDAALGTRRVGPRALGVIGDVLSRAGLTVDVGGPTGSVITAGAGVHSLIGALITGSTHLRLNSIRAAATLARRISPAPNQRRALYTAAAGLLALITSRRRRRPPRRSATTRPGKGQRQKNPELKLHRPTY